MKKFLFFIFSLIIGAGLFIWVIEKVGWQAIVSSFYIFSGKSGAAKAAVIFFLSVLMIYAGAWKWKIVLKNQGHNLKILDLFKPYLGGFAISYLAPMLIFGGELFRAYTLKDKFFVPWKKAITSVIIDRILELTSYLVAILAGIIFFLFKIGLPPKNLGIIFGLVIFLSLAAVVSFYFKVFKRESIAEFFLELFGQKETNGQLIEAEEEFHKFFKLKGAAMWQSFGVALLRVVITGARCWLLMVFLGQAVSLSSTLPILSFYYLAMLIPIPALLGSHEAIQTFAFGALKIEMGAAFAFTMVQRAAEMILTFGGIIIILKFSTAIIEGFISNKIKRVIKK